MTLCRNTLQRHSTVGEPTHPPPCTETQSLDLDPNSSVFSLVSLPHQHRQVHVPCAACDLSAARHKGPHMGIYCRCVDSCFCLGLGDKKQTEGWKGVRDVYEWVCSLEISTRKRSINRQRQRLKSRSSELLQNRMNLNFLRVFLGSDN